MNNLKINHVAVWLCIILMHGFGFLWYGPSFGEKWMAIVNLDQATMQEESMNAGVWIMNSVAIIAPIYLLAWLLTRMNIVSGVHGAVISHYVLRSSPACHEC